ncbi:MAG: thermonuclease family protein [Alphaproteobacteria bacterium]|nr:thermonuclease family protein [Alphaproteobacteria bacterium]
MKKLILACTALACLFALPAEAQMAPPPRKMPRIPVARQSVEINHEAIPASREVKGPASIIDGEKLHIGAFDLRLFGIVPPQLAASFGPQARAALDQMANGDSVTCHIRDRDRDGRLLATCNSAKGNDMALELLKRGLAVTARGSIAGTDLAGPYLSAELAAQNQKLGLWSVAVPLAANVAAPAPAAKVETPAPAPVADVKKDDKPIAKPSAEETQAKVAADIVNQRAEAASNEDIAPANDLGFFERYQLLLATCLMLATALSVIGAMWARKRSEKIDEHRSLAAALRGELMAARGVCIGRIKNIESEEDDRASTWPRIRATLYQAYVGRIGLLGAELARQVTSIYGQASDYASFYSPTGVAHDTPKKHALETLVRHIDEILPRLALIEQSGSLPHFVPHAMPRSRYDRPALPRRAAPPQLHYQPQPAPQPAPQPQAEAEEEPFITEAAAPESPPPAPVVEAVSTPVQNAVSAWEAVRAFIQNHTPVVRQAEMPPQQQEYVSDYAAIIEADMARYTYAEGSESPDLPSQKKRS